jgi:hypothetical protein
MPRRIAPGASPQAHHETSFLRNAQCPMRRCPNANVRSRAWLLLYSRPPANMSGKPAHTGLGTIQICEG